MDELQLPRDFSDFLRLLNSARVEYLLVGGYAVGLHGYPRATWDMDILVAADPENAEKGVRVLLDFGFSPDTINQEMFEKQRQVVRMGRPPVAIDVLTSAPARVGRFGKSALTLRCLARLTAARTRDLHGSRP